jgi:hypothetical protein
MKNNKVLLLILATTFSPFLIAGLLTSDYFSSQLSQKQHGTFLTESIFIQQDLNKDIWHLVTHSENKEILSKLEKIKIALGKRQDQVDVISSTAIAKDTTYITLPSGELLLAYSHKDIGKPLYKDLKHLIRSNQK